MAQYIESTVIEEIQCLLKDGALNHREIAQMMKVGRATVGAISRGKRRPGHSRPKMDEQLIGPVLRCPGCGAKVMMPCHACSIRKMSKSKRCFASAQGEPLELDLAGEDQIRYEMKRQQIDLYRERISNRENDESFELFQDPWD